MKPMIQNTTLLEQVNRLPDLFEHAAKLRLQEGFGGLANVLRTVLHTSWGGSQVVLAGYSGSDLVAGG